MGFEADWAHGRRAGLPLLQADDNPTLQGGACSPVGPVSIKLPALIVRLFGREESSCGFMSGAVRQVWMLIQFALVNSAMAEARRGKRTTAFLAWSLPSAGWRQAVHSRTNGQTECS